MKSSLSRKHHTSLLPVLIVAMLLFLAQPGVVLGEPGMGEERNSETSTALVTAAVLAGPVDEVTYIVGPGDVFAITISGQSVVTHKGAVTPEGTLVLPGVAVASVSGLTLLQAKHVLAVELKRVYHDVEITVVLIDLRRMRISVLGAVKTPGSYIGNALDPASTLIAMAGGFEPKASKRNITITRRSGKVEIVDLTKVRNTGDAGLDPPILDGDVILVPYASRFTHVFGAVGRQGQYECVDGETVDSLIELAGGFSSGAVRDTVELRTFVDGRTTRSRLLDVRTDVGASWPVGDGDQLYVMYRQDWNLVRQVRVDGEVRRPGAYGINEGTDTLSDIIRRAGGPTERASLHDATLTRVRPASAADLEFDRLAKTPVGDMTPTEYAYFKTRLREQPCAVVVDFEAALSGDTSEDVTLMNGDRIVIPRVSNRVGVSGQVVNPGSVEYTPGQRYGHYIREAGGFADGAKKGNIKVFRRSTGQRLTARRAGVIMAGDEIWVPEGIEGDWWVTVREIVQFVASLATVYLLVNQASTN